MCHCNATSSAFSISDQQFICYTEINVVVFTWEMSKYLYSSSDMLSIVGIAFFLIQTHFIPKKAWYISYEIK
jgi:hypothetical protein